MKSILDKYQELKDYDSMDEMSLLMCYDDYQINFVNILSTYKYQDYYIAGCVATNEVLKGNNVLIYGNISNMMGGFIKTENKYLDVYTHKNGFSIYAVDDECDDFKSTTSDIKWDFAINVSDSRNLTHIRDIRLTFFEQSYYEAYLQQWSNKYDRYWNI